MTPICALLVDDNGDFLDAAERLLGVTGTIAVVGRATSGREALEQVNRLHPDLVLMDWAMPGMSGLEATRHLKNRAEPPLVVLVTAHDAPRYRTAAREAGADGFVPKAEFHTQLVPLIQSLCA
jgi:CheY-like chemotaxis protein